MVEPLPVAELQAGRYTLHPPIDALAGYPVQALSPDEVALIVRGIDVAASVDGTHAALIEASTEASGEASGTGALVAFAERRTSEQGERWQPRVVMREAAPSAPAPRAESGE